MVTTSVGGEGIPATEDDGLFVSDDAKGVCPVHRRVSGGGKAFTISRTCTRVCAPIL